MNKLVYLFELDSVRKSEWEVDRAWKMIYKEIVLNGNRVVISFSQFTDSKAILDLMKEEKEYNSLLALFKYGALQVSGGKDWSTGKLIGSASEYIQNALEKGKDKFICSNMPILNNDILISQCTLQALRQCNLDVLKKAGKDVKTMENYIKLIINTSIQEHELTSMKVNGGHSLLQFVHKIYKISDDDMKHCEITNEFIKKIKKSIELLKIIEKKIEYTEKQSRSVWLNEIRLKKENKEIKCIAEIIIDLCYNYTAEDNIAGISKHYNDKNNKSFYEDFLKRLKDFWDEYKEGKHILFNGTVPLKHLEVKKLNWKIPERIWECVELPSPSEQTVLYEMNEKEEKRAWKIKTGINTLKHITTGMIYIMVFVIINVVLNTCSGGIEKIQEIWKQVILAVVTALVMGMVGSITLEIFHVPDVLQSMRMFGEVIMDKIRKKRFEKIVKKEKL